MSKNKKLPAWLSLSFAIPLVFSPLVHAQPQNPGAGRGTYVLGPEDQVTFWAHGAEEISGKSVAIDGEGNISLPMIGRFRAADLTVEGLEGEVAKRLQTYIKRPQVVVSLAAARSQPVSFVGAVVSPGVHQLTGGKTLLEMLMAAGGLRSDAGTHAKITRWIEWGALPLDNTSTDPTGKSQSAEIDLRKLLKSSESEQNISLRPHDVISVPVAEIVYVIGEVNRPGTFPVNAEDGFTVLQALSLAGGMTKVAAPKKAKILRRILRGSRRAELEVDLQGIVTGRLTDIPLMPHDILIVPDSGGKKFAARAIETALQTGTSLLTFGAIFR